MLINRPDGSIKKHDFHRAFFYFGLAFFIYNLATTLGHSIVILIEELFIDRFNIAILFHYLTRLFNELTRGAK